MKIDPKKLMEDLTAEQKEQLIEYQKVFMRLKTLKTQMTDIQEETTDLLAMLGKMRVKDKNKKENNG